MDFKQYVDSFEDGDRLRLLISQVHPGVRLHLTADEKGWFLRSVREVGPKTFCSLTLAYAAYCVGRGKKLPEGTFPL